MRRLAAVIKAAVKLHESTAICAVQTQYIASQQLRLWIKPCQGTEDHKPTMPVKVYPADIPAANSPSEVWPRQIPL
jgi:hypothetical protein